MSEVQSWENWLIYNQIWLHSLIFWKTGQASRNSTVILFYTFYVKNCTHSKTIQHLHLILPVSCSQFSYKVVQQSFLFFMELKPRPFSSFWSSYSPPKGTSAVPPGKREIRAWFCETTHCNIPQAKEHKYISEQVEKQFSVQKCLYYAFRFLFASATSIKNCISCVFYSHDEVLKLIPFIHSFNLWRKSKWKCLILLYGIIFPLKIKKDKQCKITVPLLLIHKYTSFPYQNRNTQNKMLILQAIISLILWIGSLSQWQKYQELAGFHTEM